jgi:hypothetical protein
MERRRLREELASLHDELSRSASVDPESRELLVALARDIEVLLERSEPRHTGEEPPLVERLRAATERFEESHPALTEAIGRIADQLARLGI